MTRTPHDFTVPLARSILVKTFSLAPPLFRDTKPAHEALTIFIPRFRFQFAIFQYLLLIHPPPFVVVVVVIISHTPLNHPTFFKRVSRSGSGTSQCGSCHLPILHLYIYVLMLRTMMLDGVARYVVCVECVVIIHREHTCADRAAFGARRVNYAKRVKREIYR